MAQVSKQEQRQPTGKDSQQTGLLTGVLKPSLLKRRKQKDGTEAPMNRKAHRLAARTNETTKPRRARRRGKP